MPRIDSHLQAAAAKFWQLPQPTFKSRRLPYEPNHSFQVLAASWETAQARATQAYSSDDLAGPLGRYWVPTHGTQNSRCMSTDEEARRFTAIMILQEGPTAGSCGYGNVTGYKDGAVASFTSTSPAVEGLPLSGPYPPPSPPIVPNYTMERCTHHYYCHRAVCRTRQK